MESPVGAATVTLAHVPGDPAAAAGLLADGVALRRRGRRFALAVTLGDVRPRLMRARSRELVAQYATWDEIRLLLDQYGWTITREHATIDAVARPLLREVIRLADLVTVRSHVEANRLHRLAGTLSRDVEIVVSDAPPIAADESGTRSDIVVYGPQFSGDELGAFVTALADVQVPVTVVARSRPRIDAPLRFETPDRAAPALGRARCIVDAESDDPGVALRLARLGRPLAVAASSGAHELLRGVAQYDAWNRRSILSAVTSSLGALPPRVRSGRWEASAGSRRTPHFDASAPLISVIVPTYDRPQLLVRTLAGIERQTYSNVEIVVVNDGGCDVRDAVRPFSRARLVDAGTNRGPAAARNRGLAEARGALVTFFDDDDEMFPDHLAVLADALLTSGLDIAYGQMLNVLAGEGPEIRSFAAHDALLDHADVQWAGSLAPTAVLFRRSLIDAVGLLDESLEIAEDYDFWLRLAAGREAARVDDVTSLYFIRTDGSQYSSANGVARYARAHATIYAKYPTARSLVRGGRDSMLEYFRKQTP